MTQAMLLTDAKRGAPTITTQWVDGLASSLDQVAQAAVHSHQFLRHGWYAAALATYGGVARTMTVMSAGQPVLALPMVRVGPSWLKVAQIPGCYWPFRSAPVAEQADPSIFAAALDCLGQGVNALRIGPIYDGDPLLDGLCAAAKARGWVALDRFVAESFMLDIAALRQGGTWPRTSTLRRNRHHEKHLAEHGALEWDFVPARDWDAPFFDALARVERNSWIGERTDGRDAKFTDEGHGKFWRAVVSDPAIADMLSAAVLRVDGVIRAFCLDLDGGPLKYAIANSYEAAIGRESPGKLLIYRNLMRAIELGTTRVDWGAGDSGYKRVIGADPGPAIRDWIFVRPGVPALVARALAWRWRGSGSHPVTDSAEAEVD